MLSEALIQRIVQYLNEQPEIGGAQIGMHANGQSRLLSPGLSPSINYSKTVMIEEVIREEIQHIPAPRRQEQTLFGSSAEAYTNESHLTSESVGAGISCGFALLSGFEMIGGVLGAAPSAGTSLTVTVAGWIGFASSSFQCANALARLYNIHVNPGGDDNYYLDNDPDYQRFVQLLDAVGLVSAVPGAYRAYGTIRAAMSPALSRSLPTMKALMAMSRAERQQAIKRAYQQVQATDEGKAAFEEAMHSTSFSAHRAAGSRSTVGAFTQATNTANAAVTVAAAARIREGVKTLIIAGANYTASASPSSLTGSSSGIINASVNNQLWTQMPDPPIALSRGFPDDNVIYQSSDVFIHIMNL